MNTKVLMTATSIFLGITGLVLTFIPEEILLVFDIGNNPITQIMLQLMGAAYVGFGYLNWMIRGALIGGIYNKPIATGNFMHFLVGAFALVKFAMTDNSHQEIIWILAIAYSIFSISFFIVFRANPKEIEKTTQPI